MVEKEISIRLVYHLFCFITKSSYTLLYNFIYNLIYVFWQFLQYLVLFSHLSLNLFLHPGDLASQSAFVKVFYFGVLVVFEICLFHFRQKYSFKFSAVTNLQLLGVLVTVAGMRFRHVTSKLLRFFKQLTTLLALKTSVTGRFISNLEF